MRIENWVLDARPVKAIVVGGEPAPEGPVGLPLIRTCHEVAPLVSKPTGKLKLALVVVIALIVKVPFVPSVVKLVPLTMALEFHPVCEPSPLPTKACALG